MGCFDLMKTEERKPGGVNADRPNNYKPQEQTERRGPAPREHPQSLAPLPPQGRTMMTPVSLLASMTVTRHVAGRTAARMSSASACPFTLDTGTKVTAEAQNKY